MRSHLGSLGWSLNPLSWVESGFNDVRNFFEPGVYTNRVAPVTVTGNSAVDDDLTTLKIWAVQVKAEGHFPTRVPYGYTFAGELCARTTGPYTSSPDATPPYVYVVAPQGILDTDHRVNGDLANDQNGVIMSFLQSIGLDPVTNPTGLSATTQIVLSVVALGSLLILTRRRE